MDSRFVVSNINEALKAREFPTVMSWNRLEGRPRTENFARALKAEVRDALWMLTKQWQMGEFRGDDAGSPIFTKVHLTTTRLTKYRPGDHATEFFDESVPLEAEVERRPIAFTLGDQKISLDLRLLMGRQWLKMVGKVGAYEQAFTEKYSIAPPDPTSKQDAAICAHREVWQTFAAASGRLMDGAALYFYLKGDPPRRAHDGIASVLDADKELIDALAAKFIAWFERLYYQPIESDAWDATRLEYSFSCSVPENTGDPADISEKVLIVDEYYHSHMDWYNFDIDAESGGLGEVDGDAPPDPRSSDTQTLMPAPVVFDGMPNTRWWTFEDRKTNFGDIKPDTIDLAKLLLIEFGLVYANDWFLIPYTLPTGSIAEIQGITVTNVFGERIWVEAAGSGADDAWQRWSMFTLNTKGDAGETADTSLLLLPTLPKAQEGRPTETVILIRDEMANMVWGIEKTVRLASGESKSGGEAAVETLNFYKGLAAENPLPAPLLDNNAKIRYEVMNSVPEHWIPLIPVHVDGSNRETQLQRAAMPRIIEDDPNKPQKVRPKTSLLREGLDRTPATAYFLHEEEVPRAGVQITQAFQRARWRNGSTRVWLSVRKQVGRGEGSSKLAYDQLVDVKPE